jgi:hypothetical protein
MITIVRKVDTAMIVPFPSIIMIHPMIPADEKRPKFLIIKKNAFFMASQK